MPRRLACVLLLGLLMAPAALARPPAPPEAERAVPGRPGWSVAEDSGCWLWNKNPKEGETLAFTGPCPAGPADGEGEGVWRWTENGRAEVERFGGTLRDGRLEGQGWYEYGENERYDGAFRRNDFHGHGVHVWPGGGRYEGLWEDDFPHGQGVYTDADGRVAGMWRSGCFFEGGQLVMTIGREDAECVAFIPRLAPLLRP
ncbi:hypothetical protein [Neoroseomonas rubea]|uniref:hypothetical protein n=1 Tax=Neoroseomonas rubea TaxID=2748666 RepID=UPI0018E02378|nr:hypothetical protein [Roseomonas rubea]